MRNVIRIAIACCLFGAAGCNQSQQANNANPTKVAEKTTDLVFNVEGLT